MNLQPINKRSLSVKRLQGVLRNDVIKESSAAYRVFLDESVLLTGLFVFLGGNPESGIDATLHVIASVGLGQRSDGLLQLGDVLALEALLQRLLKTSM